MGCLGRPPPRVQGDEFDRNGERRDAVRAPNVETITTHREEFAHVVPGSVN